jgi:hypothetical protein
LAAAFGFQVTEFGPTKPADFDGTTCCSADFRKQSNYEKKK